MQTKQENELQIKNDIGTAGYARTVGEDGKSYRTGISSLVSGAIGDDIEQLENDVEALQTTVGEHTTDIQNNSDDISDLQTLTSGHTTSIGNLQTAVGTNTEDITDLKEELENISGISEDVKVALLQIAEKVVYVDEHGQDYYDALEEALYPPADLVSISAVYTQSGAVYDTDSLDSLKADLVVTATYDDQTTETITNYTLSGTLAEGTSTITVSYGGKTTTFNVTVTEEPANYLYNWDFTQSLTDSVQGAELSLSDDASRDSSGLHFTSVNGYVELTGLNVTGYCYEIDIAEYNRQGTTHGRVFTIYQSGVASAGFMYRSTGAWAIYSKAASAWVDSELTSADALDGKTVTIKLLQNSEQSNKIWMYVYVDGELIADGDMSGSTTQNAYLGSNNGQVAYNLTITGLRIYEEV